MVADTQTPNARLTVVAPTRSNWADAMNSNMKIIDALIGTYFVVNALRGVWRNSTVYAIGDAVVDDDTSVVYLCQVAHTSANVPTTFAEDRAAHATYWSVYSSPARSRDTWLANTAYALNDFVVSGSKYAICIESHISSSDFETDLAADYWSVLVDLSSAGSLVLPTLGGGADANNVVTTDAAGTAYIIRSVADTLTMLGGTTVGKAVFLAASQAVARTAIGAQVSGSYQTASSVLTTLTSNGAPGTYGLSVLLMATVASLKTSLGLGTAAYLNVGTGASQIVQLTAASKLPAVDGSLLTNLPAPTSAWEIGDVKLRFAATAGAGWLLMNDGTIGKAGSGATYAGADYEDLYKLLYAEISDTWAPVSGGRTGNSQNDFDAGKTLTLSKVLGRALAISGSGSGLTARAMGESLGTETVTAEMPAHTHSAWRIIATVTNSSYAGGIDSPVNMLTDASFDSGGATGSASSGDGNMSVMQPTTFLNVFIRYL